MMPHTLINIGKLMQYLFGLSPHKELTGVHWKISASICATLYDIIKSPRNNRARLSHCCGKIRWYRRRIEDFITGIAALYMTSATRAS